MRALMKGWNSLVLTISKPLSAGQAQTYHQKEFTAKEQSYWSQGHAVQGEWQGRLATQYSLVGAVRAEDFAKLSQGQHPQTGEQLVHHRTAHEYEDENGKTIKTMEHRAGWDATFSAAKSVSLTALVGGDQRIREAHRESVRVALDELERYVQARIGGNHPAETTERFAVSKFEHDTARPVNGYAAPQLHTHAVIFNVTKRDNGETRALQAHGLFQSQQFATAIYQAELTYRLRDVGYEIERGRSGAPEIKGYTQEYLDASSARSQQIREHLEKTGHSSKESAEIAAHSTRDRKQILSPREVLAAHRRLAADFGNQPDAVVRAARERTQQLAPRTNSAQRANEAVTFARDKNFEREAVVDERLLVRDSLRRGMGEVRYAEVRDSLERRQTAGEFVSVQRSAHQTGRLLTTVKAIAAEREIVSRMREGQNQVEPVMSRQNATLTVDHRSHLNSGQKAVIEDVLSSPDRIQAIQGVAGAGKTTTLEVIRSAAEAKGYQVEGFAPTSRAAKQLGQAGVHSGTLQGFLARGPNMQTEPQQQRFFFIDESSLASTNHMREFLQRMTSRDRVLLIGDTRQHQGVEAGRPFQQLQEAGMRTAKLEEIVRQKDPDLKATVEMLAHGQTGAAVEALRERGKVKQIVDPQERIQTIARNYAASPERTLIVSPDNASRQELNQAVRQELKATGALRPDDHSFRVLIPRQDMTGAERAWASRYQIEDVVRYSRGSKRAAIEPRTYGTVVAVNPLDNLLTIQKAGGYQVSYDPKRLSGVSVYRETEREFSVGERIQFTAPNKQLGVANRELGIIEKIDVDSNIDLRLEDGRTVQFNATEHRHFDHGYAVTSHSSQGITADRVLINIDTSAHSQLLNSRFAYVAVSRASLNAEIYTNDAIDLGQRLSGDVSKSSAVEFSHSAGHSMSADHSTTNGGLHLSS
jgi:conjugative relaxase-like TrwC/TraI family protein